MRPIPTDHLADRMLWEADYFDTTADSLAAAGDPDAQERISIYHGVAQLIRRAVAEVDQ